MNLMFFVLFVNEFDTFFNIGFQFLNGSLNQFGFIIGYFTDTQTFFNTLSLFKFKYQIKIFINIYIHFEKCNQLTPNNNGVAK